MMTWFRRCMPLIAIFLLALITTPVWAALSDGKVSEQLSMGLYCSVGDLLEGNIGLIAGIVLVFMGLWMMIQGAKVAAALPIIIVGSLITALPSLIEVTFVGLGDMFKAAGIASAGFDAPKCPEKPPAPDTPKETQGTGAQMSNHDYDTPSDCADGGPC